MGGWVVEGVSDTFAYRSPHETRFYALCIHEFQVRCGILWGPVKSVDCHSNRSAIFCSSEMGVEQSIPLHQRRMQASPVNSLFERALLDALREMAEESSVPSEQIEHAWDPEDCSPKFRVLSDRLTARRLPSPLTTDGIRGTNM